MSNSSAPVLESYLNGRWVAGRGHGQALVNPSNGEVVGRCSTEGLDFVRALAFAREVGGPALRAMTFRERAALLSKIADVLAARRDRWYEISRINSGNTERDAAMDVDGAIGTVKYFAKLGAGLGDAKILMDAPPAKLTRDPNFQAVHLGVPFRGVAVHINAYNFPGWGLWEKASVSLLAGVPVFTKPASSTAWLAQEMVKSVVEAGLLPEGSLSIACGSIQNIFDHLETGDLMAFTGSASTGHVIRRNPVVQERGIRVNIEADSLNATIVGPDVDSGAQTFDLFVREVVNEITTKAGQKCTAIRRVLVPERHARAFSDAISAQLQQVKMGDPVDTSVNMGPLVNMEQRLAVEEGIQKLAATSEIVYGSAPLQVQDADISKGAFVGPTLLYASSPQGPKLWNELEIFGPVATLIPYRGAGEAFSVAERGGGSLVASVFSADVAFLAQAALELGPYHGRVMLVDPSIGMSQTGHGMVLPSCIHGGPGRAGAGEELGASRALWFYHQRVAIQGSSGVLGNMIADAVNPAAFL